MFAANLVTLTRELAHRYIARPRRRRQYGHKSGPFEHSTDDGLRFALVPNQVIDEEIYTEGLFEQRYLQLFRDMLPSGAVVVDIGANIGNHAIYLAPSCREVHCFEPSPPTLERLRRNVALNSLGNIVVHGVGLGREDATIPFSMNRAGNHGHSGFFPAPNDDFEEIELRVRNADEAVSELRLDRLDFVKIDVEGFEVQVFAGLQNTLRKFRPLVSFEHHEQSVSAGTYQRIRDLLPADYVVLELSYPAGASAKAIHCLKHGTKIGATELRTPKRKSYENLLAVPSERLASIRRLVAYCHLSSSA